jgi:hypothetical protein
LEDTLTFNDFNDFIVLAGACAGLFILLWEEVSWKVIGQTIALSGLWLLWLLIH